MLELYVVPPEQEPLVDGNGLILLDGTVVRPEHVFRSIPEAMEYLCSVEPVDEPVEIRLGVSPQHALMTQGRTSKLVPLKDFFPASVERYGYDGQRRQMAEAVFPAALRLAVFDLMGEP
jgi:hypothetical protein